MDLVLAEVVDAGIAEEVSGRGMVVGEGDAGSASVAEEDDRGIASVEDHVVREVVTEGTLVVVASQHTVEVVDGDDVAFALEEVSSGFARAACEVAFVRAAYAVCPLIYS